MKSYILLTGTDPGKIDAVACEFSSVELHYSAIRINEVYVCLSVCLERSVTNIFTGGLKLVVWYQSHPYIRCGSK